MKILIYALSGIGDALMFTPAITLLRKELPSAQIDAVVMFKGVKDIYERLDELDNVYYFDFMKEGASASVKFLSRFIFKYDASINVYPANRKEYNIINFITGAKKRAGIKYSRKDSLNLGWLNNVRVGEDDSVHNVNTNIKLIEKLLGKTLNEEPPLNFPLTEEDKAFANGFLRTNNINENDVVIGFHPGSAVLKNHIRRRWEPEKFAELAQRLIKERSATVLIFGGPEEEELKENIKKGVNSPKAISVKTKNLAHSAAVMKRCNVFVSNDSSLMHVASAMQLKTAAIIGPTNPAYIHPWKTKYKLVTLNLECAPCFFYSPKPLICFRDDVLFKCVKEISVDIVYRAVMELANS